MPTLNWIGKQAVVKHHQEVPYRLLEPVPELSLPSASGRGGSSRSDERAAKDGGPGLSGEAGLRSLKGGEGAAGQPDFGGNLIVQGDNLLALKALLPRYAGQVKCIYIDPPYNTGNEGWVYNDNVNSPEIKKWLGEVVGREGETLDRHDRWLCMMYPRLVLLKQFLREDGAIFISIDDNEVAALRLVLDEIYGANNFLAHVTVKANPRGRQAQSGLALVHDHFLVYAKSTSLFKLGGFAIDQEYSAQFDKSDADGKAWRELGLRQRGAESRREDRPDMFFSIFVDPRTGNVALKRSADFAVEVLPRKSDGSDGRWAWNATKVTRDSSLVYGRTVRRGVREEFDIFYRDYLEREGGRTTKPQTIFDFPDVNTEQGGLVVKEIFGKKLFAYPKPPGLIQRILQIATDKDSLILDSFAGSGTTGHAVLKQNAEDGGKRRFILLEMDGNIARTVTAERVKRVITGYRKGGNTLTPNPLPEGEGTDWVKGLGGGFQFCNLSKEPLFTAEGQIRQDVTFAQLAEFVWFRETGTGFQIPPTPPLKKGGSAAGGGGILSPLLGVHEGRAIYLLYNGILKDKSVNGGNVLTGKVLDVLPEFDGPKVIYAAACRLGEPRLRRGGIVFKQTPYALAV